MKKKLKRKEILDKACELIVRDGINGLSMRQLAFALDCSTMVLYSHFKNKNDILNGIFYEGSARLIKIFENSYEGRHPLNDLKALATACRQDAKDNPHYYIIMNIVLTGGFKPTKASIKKRRGCYLIQQELIKKCQKTGVFELIDPEIIGDSLWTTIHGFINLELSGYFSSDKIADERYEASVKATAKGFFTTNFLNKMSGNQQK